MSRGINKVILIGNVGKDPEIRTIKNGTEMIALVTIATSEFWTNSKGEKLSNTEWHRVTFFKKCAEIVKNYVKKGSKIYVEGNLKTTKFTDISGMERYATDIISRDFQMLDKKSENELENGGNYNW